MATNPKIDTNDPAQVERARALVIQILQEAHATEQALVTNLRAHIAMTPRGSYRGSLERHLTETQQHERAVARRIRELGGDGGVFSAVYGVVASAVGQVLVLTKGPLDLLRGGADGDEKLLKNARDEVVTEALEIAIYDALEALATAIGDDATARLAARHRGQEERMLEQLRGHIPKLANAVIQARATGDATYDWETTGAVDTARKTARSAQRTARSAQRKATTTRRPRVTQAEQPLADYDKLNASEAVSKLSDLSQEQLAQVVAYERANRKRATVIERAQSLQENEPFPGYDDLTARDIGQRVRDADEATAQRVRDYEGRHQRRVEVLEAASRQLSNSGSSS
jgi:ferritin-like metal-binding protein YciE